ncbi:acyltransferase [Agromyces intestinalis]|uniref:Acyltransferase n=1 Tax=Agromyces intestinalis TaxID=2592652 RepID=A0A5C1YGP4_9MICO|nr:acyltransferase [Agromyces intestinalis]QEO13932.1 acyltransferase [Agromyces intestinalis]
MTLTANRPAAAAAPAPAPTPASGRDAAIDLVRAACLVVVFVLHALMVGVSIGPGGPVLENALEGWVWFAPATWVVQVMPLFFVIGGYAAWTSWQRTRARGGTATEFVRGRIARLVRPAIALVAVVGAALAALALAGVDPDVIATASFRIGQPLWFLAVYLACTALVPAMVRLHERMPRVALAGLAVAVVAVDVLRASTGVEAVGYANLLVVWLLMQQLGFHLADGAVDRVAARSRRWTAASALGILALLTLVGPYSPDLFANLNPPTLVLVVLGVVQLMLFSLVRESLRRWAARPVPSRLVARFGEWGMTLYLWHLPAFVGLAAILLVLHGMVGFGLPEPLTAAWWQTRPLWLVAAAVVTAGLVRVFARFERGSGVRRPSWTPHLPAGAAVVAGILGVGMALVVGFAPAPAIAALTLLGVALVGSAERAGRPGTAIMDGCALAPVGGRPRRSAPPVRVERGS